MASSAFIRPAKWFTTLVASNLIKQWIDQSDDETSIVSNDVKFSPSLKQSSCDGELACNVPIAKPTKMAVFTSANVFIHEDSPVLMPAFSHAVLFLVLILPVIIAIMVMEKLMGGLELDFFQATVQLV